MMRRLYRRVRPLGQRNYRPSLADVRRITVCSAFGHWFDGQFCGRCGWFLP
jgi:hypothetical protein